MKIVGLKRATYKFRDGGQVSGYEMYFPITDKALEGVATEKIFASDAKLDGFVPALNQEVMVNFNRYGKFQSIFGK